jgi:DNA invertase Pin-like site-specific DNA recombinase
MNEKISPRHVARKAMLYVRQSSAEQVLHNPESQRLQYAMASRLHELGWRDVEVIDEDLGRSASGTRVRPGFERIVAQVCLGEVGAVAAREVSRFARNNREWYQLVEICSIVDTLLIDQDSIYNPRDGNDRLLLGLKGSLSEYELDLLRHRAEAGRRAKAARGELLTALPAGYVVGDDGGLQKDPDRRVQHAVALVFTTFLELGSARQTFLRLREHGVEVPIRWRGYRHAVHWRLPTYSIVVRMLRNPIYAGIYAYGRRKVERHLGEDGRVHKRLRMQPGRASEVLIPHHHEGYIAADVFERIQRTLTDNSAQLHRTGAAKAGGALLSGLLRCRRCGHKLRTSYTGRPSFQRYCCDRARTGDARLACLSFGGSAIDAVVAAELLRVIAPGAMAAAAQAAREVAAEHDQLREAMRLEMEALRYAAARAQRQYDQVDPDNRLVAAELEARWNAALGKVRDVEARLEAAQPRPSAQAPNPEDLRDLGAALPRLWDAPATDVRLKKRITRTLIEEILVDVDDAAAIVTLLIHWKGGVHTELHVRRRRRGEHRNVTSTDDVGAIRALAQICTDEYIALFLNRNGRTTGMRNPWSAGRVTSLRKSHGIPAYSAQRQREEGWMTLTQAAAHVGVAQATVRKAIERGCVAALHPLGDGPWIVRREELDRPAVRTHFASLRRVTRVEDASVANQDPTLPGI